MRDDIKSIRRDIDHRLREKINRGAREKIGIALEELFLNAREVVDDRLASGVQLPSRGVTILLRLTLIEPMGPGRGGPAIDGADFEGEAEVDFSFRQHDRDIDNWQPSTFERLGMEMSALDARRDDDDEP